MAKSYKITHLINFNGNEFEFSPFILGERQLNIKGIPPDPQTKIMKARDRIDFEDFDKYIIEHEMEETAFGRTYDSSFSRYIRKEYINAYTSKNCKLFILSGKKRFVLDFCRISKNKNDIDFIVLNIDMGLLLSKLPHVKGVWFRFQNGLVRASALMGSDLESTSDFQRFKNHGDISTLSFFYEYSNAQHPILVTSDGTVVLYNTYQEISYELELVLEIYKELLSDIIQEETSRKIV